MTWAGKHLHAPIAFIAAALACATGCNRPPAKPAPAPAAASAAAAAASDEAESGTIIRGKIILTGFTPTNATQTITCVAGNHPVIPDESVVMAADGALANVVVSLKDQTPVAASSLPPVVLNQVGCRYVPHLVAVRVGQPLQVVSSDATLHNVHMLPENNPGTNFGMNGPASKTVTFRKPELFPVKCDVHPWMKANVAVFDHPYYAISASDGSFVIKGVKPGQATLVLWHERFGELEQTVNVKADGPTDVSVTFKPPEK